MIMKCAKQLLVICGRNDKQTLLLKLRRLSVIFATALAFAVAGFATDPAAFAGNGNEHRVGAWSTALHQPDLGIPGLSNSGFNNQTLRQIVHTSIGGDRVRVRLSTFGA